MTFRNLSFDKDIAPESTIISLMNALEHLLARTHDRLVSEEARSSQVKSPEQPSGFFGNMDTIRICFSVWSWAGYSSDTSQQDPASLATFNYTSLRLRNRARRILEHLFAAETLECLETLVAIWCRSGNSVRGTDAPSVCGILHILDGSRPRNTIPAIFNAVYSRTNPTALDPIRMSSLTSNLADTELVAFLIAYTRSLEDDAMDEIWRDCVAFLKDVLANPLPYRQILPTLLDFTSMLAEKVDNTNFGEQRKMRRELGVSFCLAGASDIKLTIR
ncbi:hypothetical protein LTR16_006725 [Cryomyces antarcticus]|uniref:DOP1-like C-terminal domain-containing protein n=1 Tax=Cryomyces antarcticus TaxID=329879 RepID=A0ABR0KQ77_9PEZI|nr:hypothetical protein LTR16_006725 [Cryomyces antarcticus]